MLKSVLPVGSRARSLAAAVLALLVVAVTVQFLLPGEAGGGRGTPTAVLFNGFVYGCGTAITALGLVLVYRSLRIINFAQGALGAAAGRLFFEFVQFTQVPFVVALLLSVLFGAFVGAAFDMVFGRRFFNSPRIVLTVVTIAALPFIAFFLSSLMPKLPIFPRASARSFAEAEGLLPSRDFLPFPGWKFQVGAFNTDYGFPEVFNIELLLIAVIGVVCFLRFTRSGVAIRALAENSERASLLGIPVGNLSTMVWAIAGGLSTLGVIGVGSLTSPVAATGTGVFIPALLAPITAAVIARFQSIPVAVFASLLLVVTANSVLFSFPTDGGLIQVGYLVLLVGFLLFQRRRAGRSEEGAGVAWAAVKESRAIPKELREIATVRTTRWAFIAIGLAALIVYPIVVPTRFQFLGATILIQAIIGVSLVVLTGWAGQISLGQFSFAAVGGIVGGALTSKVGVPFWFAVPLASAVAGAVAVLVGLPALRLKGLFLAVTTLAFAVAAEATLFSDRYFGWLLAESVDRPTLFFIDFDQDRTMYYLSLVALLLAIVVTLNLRRSRFGRLLIAMRENEANVQSFGVSAVRLKLSAFAVSGAMAGFAGAVFVHQQRGLSGASFGSQRSLDVFVVTVLGGIGTVGGALLGATYDNLIRYFLPNNDFFRTVLGALQYGGTTLLVLYVAPGGLISLMTGLRDAWLRIIAQRRQIVVPSLFADYDPEALANRLIPLGELDSNSGLAALGPGVHFQLSSEIHGNSGSMAQLRTRNDERLAIGAAAAALGDTDAALPEGVVTSVLTAGRDDL